MKPLSERFPKIIKRGSASVKIYRGTTHDYETFTISWHEAGKRKRKTYSTLQAAKTEAEIIATMLSNADRLALELTGINRQEYLLATNELRELSIPLHLAVKEFVESKKLAPELSRVEAVKFHLAHTNPQLPKKSISTIVEECLAVKIADGLTKRYIVQLRSDLKRFSNAFHKNISDITTGELDDWLRSLAQGSAAIQGRTRNNFRTSLITLFSFAKGRGYLPKNIPTEAESTAKSKIISSEIKILTPSQMKRILENAPRDVLLHAAIGGFAGLRTAEIERLDWKDIDLRAGHIVIEAAKAKTASRRITSIPDNLKAWLCPLRSSGPVLESREVWRQLTKLTGSLNIVWSQNLLRHSAISYRTALEKDIPRIAYEAGNSPAIIFKNYRKLCTEAEARRWFLIRPTISTKTIRERSQID